MWPGAAALHPYMIANSQRFIDLTPASEPEPNPTGGPD